MPATQDSSRERWPGLDLAAGIADGDELPFEYLDCSACADERHGRSTAAYLSSSQK